MQYTQRDFLNAVLASSGLPCIAYKRPTAKSGMQHHVTSTIDESATYLEFADTEKHDYYFCISTLAQRSVFERGSERVRTQSNASHTRCFVLDMDVHAQGHKDHDPIRFYETQDEAREGVRRICVALGMPAPVIVNSGYGLHVYWPMAAGIPSGSWKPVAERFKHALQLIEPKAVADGTRVADTAGVLRVPDTFNLKNGQRRSVEIEQWYDDLLDFGAFSRQMEVRGGPVSGRSQDKPSVSLDVPREELEPVPLKNLVRNCNWTARYLKHQTTASEPEWYAMLGLAAYVQHVQPDGTRVQGEQIAHLFSKGHPEYSEVETRGKYQQVLLGQTGPTTCARMQGINRAGCEGCPFFGEVRSPASAARLSRPITAPAAVEAETHGPDGSVTKSVVHIPVPPKPYFRGEDGGVFLRTKGDDGEGMIFKIYDHDIYPTRRYRTENVETECLEVRLHLPHDGVRTFKLPTEYLADQKRLNSFLSSRGVVTEFGKAKYITKYMVDYVRDMQMSQAAEIEFSRFGWRDIASKDPKFIVGNGYISKEHSLNMGSYSHFLKDAAKAVACVGDLDTWRRAFDVYRRVPESEPYQFAVLLGFAAPLLALTEYSGVLYNMVGDSGAGKSTALRIMSSVWGQPNEHHIRPTDNEIPIYNFIGYLNSVPVAFDEMTKMDPNRLGNFVLNFTGGRGKMRATRSGANALNEVEWDTIVAATSNVSLYSKLADARIGYTAEAMRIFEVPVPASHAEYKPLLDAATLTLRDNYGLAGRVFAEWLLPRLPQVRELLHQTMAKLDRDGERRPDERYWVAALAAVQVGGTIARRLGLHTYDIPALVRWGNGEAVHARQEISTSHASPASVLADYLNATLDGTLYIREGALNFDGTYIRTIKNRMEYQGDAMTTAFVSVTAIGDYCKQRSIDRAWLKRGLQRMGIMTQDNMSKRMAAGTGFPDTSTRCWKIDLTNPNISGVVSESPITPK